MKRILFIALSFIALQGQSQIKAIRIKTTVQLNSGLPIPSGSIVVISEGYAAIEKATKDSIPCQVSCKVYASYTDYHDGKSNIPASSLLRTAFNPAFNNLKMAVSDYTTVATQDLLISVVQVYLESVYPGKIEIINL